jgi:hypothetical protein
MRSMTQTQTRQDERFWLAANLALLGLVAAAVLAAMSLG